MKKTKNYENFLEIKETAYASWRRLNIFGEEYLKYKQNHKKPISVLDIGCGRDVYLKKFQIKGDKYYGCDFYKEPKTKLDGYIQIDLNKEQINKKFKNKQFDVIFCGEVIEHLFSPDDLLEEIRDLMHKDSILILSTPNLGYYMNRFLLLFGISPLFLENSSYFKLGRKYNFFGQGNTTEGHIRLFTYGALRDLLKMKKYKIADIRPALIWNFWPDRIVNHISKSLSPDNVYILKK